MRIPPELLDEVIKYRGELGIGPVNSMGVLRLALDLKEARKLYFEANRPNKSDPPQSNPEKSEEKISKLEECLAGFLISGAINGMYISDDMESWACKILKGKQLAPAQLWGELYGSKENVDNK